MLLERFRDLGLQITDSKQQRSAQGLSQRIFLFTGSLEALSRNEAKQMVRAAGGQVASAINQRVTDLVAGAKPGSKLAEAEKLGIRILTEADFLKLIEEGGQGDT